MWDCSFSYFFFFKYSVVRLFVWFRCRTWNGCGRVYQTVPFHHISPVDRREEQLRNHNKSGVQLITKKTKQKKIQFYSLGGGGLLKVKAVFLLLFIILLFFLPTQPSSRAPTGNWSHSSSSPLEVSVSDVGTSSGKAVSLYFFFFFKNLILFFV